MSSEVSSAGAEENMKFAHLDSLERTFARSKWWKQLEDNLSKGQSEKVLSMLNENGAYEEVDESGNSPLHYTAKADDEIVTRYLLNDARIPVNSKNNAKVPPVSVAVVYNSSRVLKLLLEAGAVRKNVHFYCNIGLLHKAVYYSSLESIDVLLNVGIESSEVDENGWTPLHWGMARKEFENNPRHVDCIRKIISTLTMDKMNARTTSGKTALYIACSRGYHRGVEELLNAGADIKINSNRSWTPLHTAIHSNKLDIARLLIKAGANVNSLLIVSGYTFTLLAFIAMLGYSKIYTLSRPVNGEPRSDEIIRKIKAIWSKNYEATKFVLIEARADVESPETYDLTVEYACRSLNFELIKLLFDNGTPSGSIFIKRCIRSKIVLAPNDQRSSDKLIEQSVSRDMIDIQEKCINLLLSRGVSVDNTPINDLVPMAVSVCHSKIIRLLLKHGAVFDFKDDENSYLATQNLDAWHEIIRYTAKMQNRRDAPLNFQFDKLAEGLRNFYIECTEELERMGNELCWRDSRVTYRNLLTDGDITALARNDDLMLEVDSFDVKRCFPIYCDELMERIAEAKKRQRLMDSAAKALCRLIPIDENPIVFDNIFKYLSNFDLKALSLA